MIKHPLLAACALLLIFLVLAAGRYALAATVDQTPEAAPAPEKALPPISSKFEAGANGSRGNSETFDLRLALGSEYKAQEVRVRLDAVTYYQSSRDTPTRNEFSLAAVNDWYLPGSPWSVFFLAGYDWNEFGSWDSRVSAGAGAGYKLADREDLSSTARLGAACTREWGSENDDYRPEVLLGIDLDWIMSRGWKLHADATYYPNMQRPREFRIVSNASWEAAIAGARSANIKLGLTDEHQSEVDPGFEYNDLKYYAAIAVTF